MIPKLFFYVGLPGSGKSTHAKKIAKEYNAAIFSSDTLREELYGDASIQKDHAKLFTELHRRIKDCLREGNNAIHDATNINYKQRMAFLAELKNIPCEKICIVMATPYEECVKRCSERKERNVPARVVNRMYRQFDIPWYFEGWDDIQVEYGEYENSFGWIWDWIENVDTFDQCNPHHELTLGEHCRQTVRNADKLCAEYQGFVMSGPLRYAAMIHDCGKPFTKTFKNSKGEVTEYAHYYNHERTGSYDSLFYEMASNKLYVAALIRWHMQPYFWEKDDNEKSHNKYKKLWGENFYRDVMILHRADKEAH